MNRLIVRALNRLSAPTPDQAKDQAKDQGGVAAEYGVLLAGIVGVVAIAAAALGGRIGGLFDSILP
jgi:Flp pilus assembly pilin Flp